VCPKVQRRSAVCYCEFEDDYHEDDVDELVLPQFVVVLSVDSIAFVSPCSTGNE